MKHEETERLRRERHYLNCIAAAATTEKVRASVKSLQISQEFLSGHAFQAARPQRTPLFVPLCWRDARASCLLFKVALAMNKSQPSFIICIAQAQKHVCA